MNIVEIIYLYQLFNQSCDISKSPLDQGNEEIDYRIVSMNICFIMQICGGKLSICTLGEIMNDNC